MRTKWSHAVAITLLIVMSLAALLPNGRILKKSGPCGLALCECAAAVDSRPPGFREKSQPVFTLGDQTVSNGDIPLAFQLLLDAAISTRAAFAWPALPQEERLCYPEGVQRPPGCWLEISTPPPRA